MIIKGDIIYKICTKCKQEKLYSEFTKHPKTKDGLRYQCKSCNYEYGKDPTIRKKWSEKYYRKKKQEQPELFLFKQAKHRAKFDYNNLEFTIEISDIVIPEYCPYLNVKLDSSIKDYSPSLDRIDSSKGYTKENIQVISYKANRMKSNASKEELVQFAIGILAIHVKGGWLR